MENNNIEIIDGVEIDWSKFNKNTKRGLEVSKNIYIDLCKLINNNGHILLSEYKNNSTKILIDFNCSHEPHWMTPKHYKDGVRCPRCVGKNGQAKIDFMKILEDNGHTLLSEYKNNKTKVQIDYKCGHEPHWITPNNYKNGQGCAKCSGRNGQAKEDFLKMIEENNHTLLSEYKNNSNKVLIDYKCGHEPHWITPNNYKSGQRCAKCVGKGGQAEIDFIKMINDNGHKLLSEYINTHRKVLIDFNCGHQPHWIIPKAYKIGQRCPKCSNNCPQQSKEELVKAINNNGHKLLSEYIKATEKVLIDFNCGHEPHWIVPNAYKSGIGCPMCRNKGEAALHKLLVDMGYEVERGKKYKDLKDKRLLPYDFYLPQYNLLIELDGDHHREQVMYTSKDMTDLERDIKYVDSFLKLYDRQRKDELKNEYAKNNNIPLLRIDYYNGKIELDKWRELVLNKIDELKIEQELIAI